MPRVFCRSEYCLGCHLCEVYCAVGHSAAREVLRAFKEGPKPEPRLIVEQNSYHTQAIQCLHCLEAPCVEACISGAMTRDRVTGTVICRREQCVGCWSCVMVCPVGAVTPDSKQATALKCDLCSEEAGPWCVSHCPNQALVMEEEGDRQCS